MLLSICDCISFEVSICDFFLLLFVCCFVHKLIWQLDSIAPIAFLLFSRNVKQMHPDQCAGKYSTMLLVNWAPVLLVRYHSIYIYFFRFNCIFRRTIFKNRKIDSRKQRSFTRHSIILITNSCDILIYQWRKYQIHHWIQQLNNQQLN